MDDMDPHEPLELKARPKKGEKGAPKPKTTESITLSMPSRIVARARLFSNLRDCTLGSAGAMAFDTWLPSMGDLTKQAKEAAVEAERLARSKARRKPTK